MRFDESSSIILVASIFLATYKRWLSFQVGISSRAKFHMDLNSASGCVRGPGAVEREGGEIL